MYVDPFGEAPGDEFESIEDLAEDWLEWVQSEQGVDKDGKKIELEKAEYGSIISQSVDAEGNVTFSYNAPWTSGSQKTVPYGGTRSQLDNAVGNIHNHNTGSTKPSFIEAPTGSKIKRGNGTRGASDHNAAMVLADRSKVVDRRNFVSVVAGPRSGDGSRDLGFYRFTFSGPKKITREKK